MFSSLKVLRDTVIILEGGRHICVFHLGLYKSRIYSRMEQVGNVVLPAFVCGHLKDIIRFQYFAVLCRFCEKERIYNLMDAFSQLPRILFHKSNIGITHNWFLIEKGKSVCGKTNRPIFFVCQPCQTDARIICVETFL